MAQDRFDADLHIIANSDLEITQMDGDLNIIQKLSDEPNDQDGLTADQLKAKFDQAGLTIQSYINETLIPQVNGTIAVEAQRVANENQRQANEAVRQDNEAGRAAAETERGTAEAGRVSAETARGSAEAGRVSAETARAGAESDRVAAESGRASAETARGTAEIGRVQAESGRVSAEAGRASAESARVTAENGRVAAENGRASAENGRVSAETARVQAETARENAQTAFFQGVSASAEMLPQGSDATASAVPEGGSFRVNFGIPAGGPAGKSAYQYAVDGGYAGTEAEFQALMGSGPWVAANGGTAVCPFEINGETSEFPAKMRFTTGIVEYSYWDYNVTPPQKMTVAMTAIKWEGASFSLGTDIFMNQNRIRGLSDPEDAQEPATKGYVDNRVKQPEPGTITWIPISAEVPEGYLLCSGAKIGKYSAYSLYTAIEQLYLPSGETASSSEFYLPNIPEGAIPGMKAVIKS